MQDVGYDLLVPEEDEETDPDLGEAEVLAVRAEEAHERAYRDKRFSE